jgi:hypothetical protein
MGLQKQAWPDELPTRFVVRDCAMALDGGSIQLGATDQDGRRVSIVLATSRPSSVMRVAGRLYFNRDLVPMRSEREARIVQLLLEAKVKAASLPSSLPTAGVAIVGADIKEFFEQLPEENCKGVSVILIGSRSYAAMAQNVSHWSGSLR